MALFQDLMGSSPLATASRMCEILGNLPREWMAFPFDDDYPVHEPLQRGIEYTTLGDFTERNSFTLNTEVGLIREPQGPVSTSETASGREWLCLTIPTFWDTATRDEFRVRNLKPIGKDDAALFTDLLCKIFDYNHQKRLTARQVLAHPWLKETSQKPSNSGSAASSVQNLPVRPKPHSHSASLHPPPSPAHRPNTTHRSSSTTATPTREVRKERQPEKKSSRVEHTRNEETQILGMKKKKVEGQRKK